MTLGLPQSSEHNSTKEQNKRLVLPQVPAIHNLQIELDIAFRDCYNMADAFRSARLIYRAIEKNDDDLDFIHSLRLESASRATNENRLFKPINRAQSEETATRKRDEAVIGVIICLPISTVGTGADYAEISPQRTIPIGLMDLHPVKKGFEHHRTSDIGIQIAEKYQRKGYGSEALKWILGWAFQHGTFHRVGLKCFSYNPGARRLYERLGFKVDGVDRESVWYDGAWYDEVTLSMLEDEWREKRAAGEM